MSVLLQQFQLPTKSEPFVLLNGDSRELLRLIPDAAVDAIVTDPPYPREFDHVWDILADEAPRVLKPGGHLVTLLGHYQLPRVLDALRRTLEYRWICSLRNAEGINPIMHGYRVKVNWKPALWFTNGKAADHEIMDDELFRAGKRWAKVFHTWNQPIVLGPIVKLVREGGIVLDPFLGSGTTLIACAQTGRHGIGFEIDTAHLRTAQQRIDEARGIGTLFPPIAPALAELFSGPE